MARQGYLTEVVIVGGEHAGIQAVLCPSTENTEVFLRHLVDRLIRPASAGRYFNYTTTAGKQTVDRQDITAFTVTIS